MALSLVEPSRPFSATHTSPRASAAARVASPEAAKVADAASIEQLVMVCLDGLANLATALGQPQRAAALLDAASLLRQSRAPANLTELTAREREVAALVTHGRVRPADCRRAGRLRTHRRHPRQPHPAQAQPYVPRPDRRLVRHPPCARHAHHLKNKNGTKTKTKTIWQSRLRALPRATRPGPRGYSAPGQHVRPTRLRSPEAGRRPAASTSLCPHARGGERVSSPTAHSACGAIRSA